MCLYIAIIAECPESSLCTPLRLSEMSSNAARTNSTKTQDISTNLIIRDICKVLSLGDSLLEGKHALYRSLLHSVQLVRSAYLRHRLSLRKCGDLVREGWKRWDAREGESRWHQSISSLSDDRGGFLLTFWLSDIEINDGASVGLTKTHLLIPLAIYFSTLPFIISVCIRELLFLLQGHCQCVYVLCVCVLGAGFLLFLTKQVLW